MDLREAMTLCLGVLRPWEIHENKCVNQGSKTEFTMSMYNVFLHLFYKILAILSCKYHRFSGNNIF